MSANNHASPQQIKSHQKDAIMNNVIQLQNESTEGLQTIVNDLAFQIQFRLQLRQGRDLVSAIGYPDASTHDVAIKRWVYAHVESYAGLERPIQVQMMADEISSSIQAHLGEVCFYRD